jgi:hypothetical protein
VKGLAVGMAHGGALGVGGHRVLHPEPAGRDRRGDHGLGAASGAGLAQGASQPPCGGLLIGGRLAGDARGAAGGVAGVAGEDPGGGVADLTAGLVLGLAGLSLAGRERGRRRELGPGGVLDPRGRVADREATGEGGPPASDGSAFGAG